MSNRSTHNRRGTLAFPRTLTAVAAALLVSLAGPGTVASGAQNHAPGHECATPSIDRLQQWIASGEGTTVPATGSLLVPERHGYSAKVTFLNDEWHVAVVWLGNQFESQADLSRSRGFWMTYSATDDLYVQLRPASHWNGGDKWLTLVPSTGGKTVKRFFSFADDNWTTLPELGAPTYSFASALTEARGLVFVGKTANTIDFRGLRIHGYRPPCL
ncbi:hypothetical protein SRB5_01280 [Streptomyces sp. RB5]|uniref:Uncharacterized protein n=1 Tax=Streptomyces smaragdinus TaxID=2585196 RepID=A0A7K0CB67_9ACTN|nr:hypothetical protein [Streptomyces smaragdinus]MQY10024.1 hypothetical protein [Streptomyces smaragdinus]